MNLEVQPIQLITLLIYTTMGLFCWKIKNKWFRTLMLAFAVIWFAVAPVRFKQSGVASLEHGGKDFTVMPERVTVDSVPFDQQQDERLRQLNKKSQEKFNDTF